MPSKVQTSGIISHQHSTGDDKLNIKLVDSDERSMEQQLVDTAQDPAMSTVTVGKGKSDHSMINFEV